VEPTTVFAAVLVVEQRQRGLDYEQSQQQASELFQTSATTTSSPSRDDHEEETTTARLQRGGGGDQKRILLVVRGTRDDPTSTMTAATTTTATMTRTMLLLLVVLLFLSDDHRSSSSSFGVVTAAADPDEDIKPPPPMPDDFDPNAFGAGQNCQNFRCSKNYEPVPKSRLSLSSSGCSSMGGSSMIMMGGSEDEVKKKYEDCCHQWHACYQICGSTKKSCDEQFKTCSAEKCAADDECKKSADLSSMLLNLSGCRKYDEMQLKGCECIESKSAPKARTRILSRFYEKFAASDSDADATKKKVDDLMKKADTKLKFATLLNKLVAKYSNAVKIVDDPQRNMYQKIMEEAGKSKSEKDDDEATTEDNDDDDDDSEQHIEL